MNAGTKVAASAARRRSQAQAKREPGAGGGAVHRREHRLLERTQRTDVRVVAAPQAVADVSRRLAELGQVLPDAEPTPRARDHDGAHLVASRLLQRGGQRAVQVGVERVEHVRPVERDRQDRAVSARLGLGHRRSL